MGRGGPASCSQKVTQRGGGQSKAVPGRAGRAVAGAIVVAIIAIGVIMGFNPFGSNVPEGVDPDAASE